MPAQAGIVPDRADGDEPCVTEQPDRRRAVLALPGEIAPVEPIEVPCRAQVDVGIRKLQELDVAQVIGAIRRTRPQIGDLPKKRAVGILRELILRERAAVDS
jgi:hypothetical protein